METTEKPSYCPEHHKWAIRIYPGGRNKWREYDAGFMDARKAARQERP